MINKTKIDWTDFSWNPVWGCLNNCEYCYARKIAKRFHEEMARVNYDPNGEYCIFELTDRIEAFKPTWLEHNFKKPFPKKPSRIFVNSMSEIYYWKRGWTEKVLEKIKEYPQHTFQFLTKFPEVYDCDNYSYSSKNCWFGVTVNDRESSSKIILLNIANTGNNTLFVSFEPLLGKIDVSNLVDGIDWVIIGAETGNRKGKIILKKKWVEEIIDQCDYWNIPVFTKENLWKIYPGLKRQEFPKG